MKLWVTGIRIAKYGAVLYENFKTSEKKAALSAMFSNRSSPSSSSQSTPSPTIKVPEGVGRSLFADDGALWKRGKNIHYLVNKVQDAIDYVVEWGLDWGFRFSVEKTKVMFFTEGK
ncbi:hypothetical protein WMY93_023272 [Mugilogobius chulae]|uniref:Reverse transcriptase n=1 Tax=Mugilogobius chulae TaxID=88201 RepID=A0AAW0NG80_9GOBI